MKGLFKKGILCLLCLTVLLLSVSVGAAEQEVVISNGFVDLPTVESYGSAMDSLALDSNGKPALKSGNYERWIDRLDLSDAAYAMEFYGWLEDNSNVSTGTGALIDPTQADKLSSGEYVHLVTTVSGTGTYTYTGDSATDKSNAYAAITGQISANEKNIFAHITAAYSAFDRDHPEVFWLSGSSKTLDRISYSYNAQGQVSFTQYIYFALQTSSFDVRAEKYRDAAGLRGVISNVFGTNGSVAQILSGATGSKYDMVRYFNKWLTEHNSYNSNPSSAGNDVYECISGLTGCVGTTGPVCEGYARAFKVLCDRVGIPCVLVNGKAINNTGRAEAHMWNYVKMNDGNWYGMDVTWNDPVSGSSGAISGGENEKYVLVGSNAVQNGRTFIQSHPVSNTVTSNGTAFTNGPELTANDYVPVTVAPTVTAKSFTLSFEDEILVNLYYTVSDMSDVAEHGMLVFHTNPGVADFAQADEVYNTPSYDASKDRYMTTTAGIAAKEMGDTRYYVAYAKLHDGSYAYSSIYDYSPKKYSMNMLSKASTSDKQKALCVAMLNYGAAAQSYFNYNTGTLMNGELTPEQSALVTVYDSGLFAGAVAPDSSKTANFTETAAGFAKKSVTVSFEGAFCVNYYFTPDTTVSGTMKLYYWTPEDYASATTMTADNASGCVTMTAGTDGRYWGQVSGIAAKSLDETYYVAGVYTDAQGNTCCTGIIAYSLSKYCMNNASGAMGNLAQATAMYGYYAKLYFTA